MKQNIRVGKMNEKGEELSSQVIVVDDAESNDPLAFSWGRMQGQNGEPMEEGDVAPEYVRGYNLGRKEWESKQK